MSLTNNPEYKAGALNQMGANRAVSQGTAFSAPAPPKAPDQYEQRVDEAAAFPMDRYRRWGTEGARQTQHENIGKEAAAEGFRLADVEQQGIDEAKDLWRREAPGIMASPMTDRDIGNLYAGMLEDIARQRASDMEAVTQYTGQAGLRGGVAADLVAQVELGSLGQVSRGMRDMRQIQTDVEARHKLTQLNSQGMGAQILASSPSTLAYESLANLGGIYGDFWAADRGDRLSYDAERSQQKAALLGGGLSLASGLAGGLLG